MVPNTSGNKMYLATELQVLVTQSFLTMPHRIVSGIDSNRLNLVIAVLGSTRA